LLCAILVTGAVTATSPACASKAPPKPPPVMPPLLTWLGDFTRPAGTAYPQLPNTPRFGSLSGLVHDVSSGNWLAVIDDREDSRLAWVSIGFDGKRLNVAPIRMQPLRPGPGVADRLVTQADLEAITALPDGTFIVAEEGHVRDGEIWQPALMRLTRDGVVTSVINFPPPFQITGDETSGLRDNQGVESLTRTPSGTLIAGLEQPLFGQSMPTFEQPGLTKLIEFLPVGDSYTPGRQWNYMLSPTPRMAGMEMTCADGENGLVDMVALSDTRLVTLERACLRDAANDRNANPVRLYVVELQGTDARKTMLLDLEQMIWRLPPELSRLDNYEALAFGPIVNNARTLLVVSDDNFRKTQRTSFLLFGIYY
jgi:hypothetical protein